MKIFIGTAEIAGMVHFLASALKACGHQVTTCVDNAGTGFFNYEYDRIIKPKVLLAPSTNKLVRKANSILENFDMRSRRRKLFDEEKTQHDLFIFIWNGLLIDSLRDYQELKQRGKKIASIFLGSDVRHVSAFAQQYRLDVSTWEQWFHSTDLNDQLFRLRKAELYSDSVFSLPDQAGLAIRPYHKIYIPFNISAFRFNVPGRPVPRIVHIPSRTGIKGTAFIVQAMEELKSGGIDFDFEIVTGVSNTKVHQLLYDADILVDELYLHGPGTLSLEGIASGCAVATKTMPGEAYDTLLCNVDFDNFKAKIRQLIVDVEYRIQLAQKSLEGIRLLNDPVRIATDIVSKTFQTVEAGFYDYSPKFFSDSYILPSGTNINNTNLSLTRRVVGKFRLNSELNLKRMKSEHLI